MEEWKAIEEVSGRYEVSSRGRVRHAVTKRVRKLKERRGYLSVNLSVDGRVFWRRVNRLVCAAFVGPPEAGEQADHIDRDPSNNRADNLRWVSAAENLQRRVLDFCGERHSQNKLTWDAVRVIRERHARGESQAALAAEFGVTQPNVSMIVRRKTWIE